MADSGLLRLGRELFMAALGLPLDVIEPWAVDRMTSLLEEWPVTAGDVLYRSGESPDFFYFMQDGEVRVTPDRGPSWAMRGRWAVGALEAVLDTPRTSSATALTDFQAMRVAAGGWIELLEDSFQIAQGAVMNAGRAAASLEERISELPKRPPRPWTHLAAAGEAPLTLVERLALLVDVRMFGNAGVQSVADLAAASQEVAFATGDVILERGSPRSELLVVIAGEVEARRTAPDVLRHYGPGDLLLGAASFTAAGPTWEARAVEPGRLLSFPREFWFDLMAEHFDLVRSTLAALAARRDVLLEVLAGRPQGLVLT
jgi:CRP-like cAMP-binding protein